MHEEHNYHEVVDCVKMVVSVKRSKTDYINKSSRQDQGTAGGVIGAYIERVKRLKCASKLGSFLNDDLCVRL